jgi:hypothetical protein
MDASCGTSARRSVREVMDALNARAGKPRAYTTYMTILARLHGKGLLARRREGKTDLYRPVHTRERVRRPARAGRGGGARRRVRRRRAQPLRPPDGRARPRAPRGARAPRRGTDCRATWGVYRLQLALGAAGLGGAALALAPASAVHVAPAAAHRLDVAGLRFTYPAVNAAAAVLLALAALGAAVLVVAAARGLAAGARAPPAVRALPVAGPLPGHPAVAVIDAGAPLAFCAGWLRPRVYVSTAALERLSATSCGRARARAAPPRAARPAAARRRPRALPGAVLPAGPAPAARALRRGGRAARRRRRRRGGRRRPPRRWPRRCSPSARAPSGDVVGISPEPRRLAARPAAGVAAAAAAARRGALTLAASSRSSGARAAAPRAGDAQPADRLVAALRARAGAGAGRRLPGGAVAPPPARARRA